MYKANKVQGYTVQQREYSQYFIITINGVQSIKMLNLYCTPETNIVNKLYLNFLKRKQRPLLSQMVKNSICENLYHQSLTKVRHLQSQT